MFRDEITYEDGILYKGAQLIMPKSETESTIKVIHMGHNAIEKMKLRAKETVYWPGITEDTQTPTTSVQSVQNLPRVNKERCCSL